MSPALIHLMIFAKAPLPGLCKTRLMPALGALGAARLHEALVKRQIAAALRLQASMPEPEQEPALRLTLYTTGEDLPAAQTRYPYPRLAFAKQNSSASLGVRMADAFAQHFALFASQKALLVGSDAPGLDAAYLAQAIEALESADVVLGPALDGGYTLIGLNAPAPGLFDAVAWSTDQVLAQTCARAHALGLRVHKLPPLSDIDTPQDLANLPLELKKFASPVSVVIPTLNEAEALPATLAQLPADDPSLDVIVVDGGSKDNTTMIAQALGARVIEAPAGRGQQLTQGGRAAGMPTLFFLHADTHVPASWRQAVDLLAKPGVGLVSFPLRIRSAQRWARWIGWGATLRSRLLGLPYGDQGLLIAQKNFKALGGFTRMAMLEDLDFVRRARRLGRLALHTDAVATSPRRWQALGPLRTTLVNQLMLLGYVFGVSPARLARFYRSQKEHSAR